jgi:hypothetical protein
MGAKKLIAKCVSAGLILNLAFGSGVAVFAQDDAWGDFDAGAPMPNYEATPSYGTPSYSEPAYTEPSYDAPPYSEPSYGAPSYSEEPYYGDPSYSSEPQPSYGTADLDTFDESAYDQTVKVDAASEGFIKVIRHKRNEMSEFPDAVIEGLQVSVDKGAQDEVFVSCYFIFRDKPSSYFYNIDRKENKLIFEFVDARAGSSPIAALEQAPIKEIVIEEDQSNANKEIKGLNPEWHDVIRISFELEYLPVISVTNEQNIISFSYKWTTDSEKIPLYLHKDKFPMVFWLSGGVLGAIGGGVLTYFLLPKKDNVVSNVLSKEDLPQRTRQPRPR